MNDDEVAPISGVDAQPATGRRGPGIVAILPLIAALVLGFTFLGQSDPIVPSTTSTSLALPPVPAPLPPSSDSALSPLTELRSLVGDVRISYVTEGGVTVIDTATATMDVIRPIAFDQIDALGHLSRYDILTEGSGTFGLLSNREPIEVHVLSSVGRVVPSSDDGVYTVSGTDSAPMDRVIMGTDMAVVRDVHALPAEWTQISVPNVGVLMVPPDSATYLARIGGLDLFSLWTVTAATETHHIERRCVDTVCEALLVNRINDNETPLPDRLTEPDGRLTISPDGRWVTLTNAAQDVVYDVTGESITLLGNAPKGDLSWAPDSSYAAWLDTKGDPTLLFVLYPGDAAPLVADLTNFGAQPARGDTVLALKATAP